MHEGSLPFVFDTSQRFMFSSTTVKVKKCFFVLEKNVFFMAKKGSFFFVEGHVFCLFFFAFLLVLFN